MKLESLKRLASGKVLVAVSVISMGAGLMTLPAGASSSIASKGTVYIIPKDTTNPYEVIADAGVQKALSQQGWTGVVDSGTVDTAAAQEPAIQAAIAAKASAIVIAANDPSALCPSLAQAVTAGITIIGFDSDNYCPGNLFINQANTQQIGASEVTLLAKEIHNKGQIAILSAAATASNQNSWIHFMKVELKHHPKMKLVATVYGNDDPTVSLTVLQGLLAKYPKLAGIISPTTVGISTAAQYLSTHESKYKKLILTGLGLPSQMKGYTGNANVKAFELWNPFDLGYLAGIAAMEISSGVVTNTPGQTLTIPANGTKLVEAKSWTIVKAAAGSTDPSNSVTLGNPFVFTKSNVGKFNF
jgi:rhamnose transport system substrate-binding protein